MSQSLNIYMISSVLAFIFGNVTSQMYKIYENSRILNAFAIAEISPITNCFLECDRAHCSGMNYHKKLKKCELSNYTSAGSSAIVYEEGWSYGEKENKEKYEKTEVVFNFTSPNANMRQYVVDVKLYKHSVCAWMKLRTHLCCNAIYDSYTSDGEEKLLLFLSNHRLMVKSPSFQFPFETKFNSTEWNHICMVKNANVYKMYLNATLTESKEHDSSSISDPDIIVIGADKNGHNRYSRFMGEMSGFNIWNDALDAFQVKKLFNDGKVEGKNLLLSWSDFIADKYDERMEKIHQRWYMPPSKGFVIN